MTDDGLEPPGNDPYGDLPLPPEAGSPEVGR
jgi:hypothetical protein